MSLEYYPDHHGVFDDGSLCCPAGRMVTDTPSCQTSGLLLLPPKGHSHWSFSYQTLHLTQEFFSLTEEATPWHFLTLPGLLISHCHWPLATGHMGRGPKSQHPSSCCSPRAVISLVQLVAEVMLTTLNQKQFKASSHLEPHPLCQLKAQSILSVRQSSRIWSLS